MRVNIRLRVGKRREFKAGGRRAVTSDTVTYGGDDGNVGERLSKTTRRYARLRHSAHGNAIRRDRRREKMVLCH